MEDKRKEYLAASRRKVAGTLKEIRKYAGISRREIAEKLGVSKQVIHSAEQGRNRADIAMVMAYCDVLGCRVDVGVVNVQNDEWFYFDYYNNPNTNDTSATSDR